MTTYQLGDVFDPGTGINLEDLLHFVSILSGAVEYNTLTDTQKTLLNIRRKAVFNGPELTDLLELLNTLTGAVPLQTIEIDDSTPTPTPTPTDTPTPQVCLTYPESFPIPTGKAGHNVSWTKALILDNLKNTYNEPVEFEIQWRYINDEFGYIGWQSPRFDGPVYLSHDECSYGMASEALPHQFRIRVVTKQDTTPFDTDGSLGQHYTQAELGWFYSNIQEFNADYTPIDSGCENLCGDVSPPSTFESLTTEYQNLPANERQSVTLLGNIVYVDLEGGFYGIEEQMASATDTTPNVPKYLPLNIQSELVGHEGKEIQVTQAYSKLGDDGMVGIFMWGKMIFVDTYEIIEVTPSPTPITDANFFIARDLWFSDESGAIATYGHIRDWDVSAVTNMYRAFHNKESFNEDISGWNVSKVTMMAMTFENAKKFNQDISDWNVSSVTNMNGIFDGASEFNQDIGNWNVENADSMQSMFKDTSFNQNIGGWTTSSALRMSGMFNGNRVFNQDISNWNVSKVKDFGSMFRQAMKFNQPIGKWDVSSAENTNTDNMKSMFYEAYDFNQDLSGWCVYEVSSEPSDFFQNGHPMKSSPEKHPKWGEPCTTLTPVSQMYPLGIDTPLCEFGVKAENGKYHLEGITTEDFDPDTRNHWDNPTLSWEEAPTLIIDPNRTHFDGIHPAGCSRIGFRLDEVWKDSGHPFAISTTPDGTHNGGTELDSVEGNYGWDSDYPTSIDFEFGSAPLTGHTTLYYYCKNHPGMGGMIIVQG